MRLDRILITTLAVAAIAACSDDSTDPGRVATSITVEMDTLDYGATVSPEIVVKDQNGSPMTGDVSGHLTLESSDTTIATVDMDAMSITGTGIGEATITVRYDGIEVERVLPVRLGPAPAERLAAGGYHTCALLASGAASCWGENGKGELGNEDTVSSGSPVAVHGSHTFSSITATYFYTCGLEDGAVWCWGYGEDGELGNGGDSSSALPVKVSGGSSFVQVSAGDAHACGLVEDGTAYCWGYNDGGDLGIGSSDGDYQALEPERVSTTVKFAQITAAGQRTCALTRLGKAYCWGAGWWGALGTGDDHHQYAPVAVLDTMTFVRLVGGYYTTCGMDREGKVFCWGYNYDGEAGNNSTENPVFAPVQVETTVRFSTLSNGQSNHLCGIARSDNSVYCWGYNSDGQIGDGAKQIALVPVKVPSLHARAVAAGDSHTCAEGTESGVYCWGFNFNGQVGTGVLEGSDVLSPSEVHGLGDIAMLRGARGMAARSPVILHAERRSPRGDRNRVK